MVWLILDTFHQQRTPLKDTRCNRLPGFCIMGTDFGSQIDIPVKCYILPSNINIPWYPTLRLNAYEYSYFRVLIYVYESDIFTYSFVSTCEYVCCRYVCHFYPGFQTNHMFRIHSNTGAHYEFRVWHIIVVLFAINCTTSHSSNYVAFPFRPILFPFEAKQ